jgi:Leucine-rich repeat (LRR) protein
VSNIPIFASGENVQKLLDLLDQNKLVSADFEDVRKALSHSTIVYIGTGRASGAVMFEKAAKQAMENLSLREAAQAMIISLKCPPDSGLGEIEAAVSEITCSVFPDAPILWCAELKDNFVDEVQIDLFAAANIDSELKTYKYEKPFDAGYKRNDENYGNADEIYSNKVIKNDEDGIPDSTLYRFALEALHCQPEELTEKKAATLKELRIDCRMIKVKKEFIPEYRLDSLKGISYFRNLTYLNIEFNELRDISPVSDLHYLCDFSVNGPIQSLEPIRGLQALRYIDFSGCNFEDIFPLGKLTNLEELTICSCGISDISSLEKLTRLMELCLTSNSIQDIRPLLSLHNLCSLDLNGNNCPINLNTIDALRAIAYNNPNLKSLSFSNWD